MSKKYSLNAEDGLKILKVFGYLLASTTIAFAIDTVSALNFGDYGWLVPIINILLVTVQRAVAGYSK